METPCLTTERLLLRPFKKEDAEDLYRWTSSIRCTEYLFWHPNRSLEDAQRILARWVDKPRQYAWALELNGHAVGEINVIKTLPDKGYEIGYILRDDLWGHGYMFGDKNPRFNVLMLLNALGILGFAILGLLL